MMTIERTVYYRKMPNRLPNFCLINTKSCLIAIWPKSRGPMRESEICVASDRPRLANVSTEYLKHVKHFISSSITGACFIYEPVLGPLVPAKQCIRANLSSRPTILAPVMTRLGPAQCPILYCNFSVLMHQIRILQSQPLPINNSMSRTGSRTALISTRPLSLPSAGAFLQSVLLKRGKLMFRMLILTGLIAILYSILPHPASAVSSARECLGRLLRNGP